ncbi:unnamed protein product, partial [Bubo scandiacus]
ALTFVMRLGIKRHLFLGEAVQRNARSSGGGKKKEKKRKKKKKKTGGAKICSLGG